MSFSDEYKQFRRYMRRFDLRWSLVDVWRYSLHVMERQPLPHEYAHGKSAATPKPLNELLYPWDLDILARELVLNATRMGTRSLKEWDDLATSLNWIRQLENTAYAGNGVEQIDAMLELHRTVHRQFPWQMDHGDRPVMRALKIFGETAVDAIVVRKFGMTTRQFMRLGMAVYGSFQTNWHMSVKQDCSLLGISREAADAFFDRITCTLEQLKEETEKYRSYGRNWLYTWNPLQAKPLVSVSPIFGDHVLCPIPRYLGRRVSVGIFYDLIGSTGFDNAFGDSFQSYVGDIIRLTCSSPPFVSVPERPYGVGSKKMHGVDWILSDHTAHLFIECKTKRLTMGAKTLSDPIALEADIIVMATAIVQHYRNVRDALDSKTSWVPDGLPIFLLVLTLEDWLIFSLRVDEMLSNHVRRLLIDACIPERVLEEMPYTIASAQEFEIATQIIAQAGICSFMARKTMPEWRKWLLFQFARTVFEEEMRRVNWCLFDDGWTRLMRDGPDG